MSSTGLLVIVILLCSIVCTATNLFGRVTPAQSIRIVKKEVPIAQITTQFAEKSESETKTEAQTKHNHPLFVIRTVMQLFDLDAATPAAAGFVYSARFGIARFVVPLYLAKRTIRI